MYGKLSPLHKDALYKIGGSADAAMAMTYKDPFTILMGLTTPTVVKWKPFTAGVAVQGNYRSKVYELPKLSMITGITVYYPKLSAANDADVTLTTYLNYSSTPTTTQTINYQNVSSGGDGNRGFKYIPLGGGNYDNVNAIQIGFAWDTVELISKSIRPSRIEIDYEETEKKL